MGLFGKKTCDICGASIGMLSNKKLADGNMCKDCAKKLSPWFEERKHSTIEQIKEQLKSREEDRKKLEKFETSHVFGEDGVIVIDEKHKQLVALPNTSDRAFGNNRNVADLADIIDKNPDIVSFDQIKDFKLKENITSREEKQTVNGEQKSYNPRHMTYMCSVTLILKVEGHPYIETMMVPLNSRAIEIRCDEPRKVLTYEDEFRSHFNDLPDIVDYEHEEAFYTNDSLIDRIFRTEYDLPDYSYGFKVDKLKNWKNIQRFHYLLLMCQEIEEIVKKGQKH